MPPIFAAIETTAFSGATLLAALLGAHPAIATVAEMNGLIDSVDPDEYLCSCGQRIQVCEFWQSVKKGMETKGFDFDVADFNMKFISGRSSLLHRLREGSVRINWIDSLRDAFLFALPGQTHRFHAKTDRNEAFIKTVLSITGKQVFVDSSKDRLRPKVLRRFSSLDVRVIHLVRDVRGVVASNLRRYKTVSAGQVAHDWRQLHRRVKVTLESWPKDKYIVVRYEDLCQNMEKTLKRLYVFCDAGPNFKINDLQSVSDHLIGNPMRLSRISELKLDERWKDELTASQLKEIEQVAGPVGRQYGYFDKGTD